MEAKDMVMTPEQIVCPVCNGPMSRNPHPDAGKPSAFLEVGVQWECIPCTVANRHRWAERAQIAEGTLAILNAKPKPEQAKPETDPKKGMDIVHMPRRYGMKRDGKVLSEQAKPIGCRIWGFPPANCPQYGSAECPATCSRYTEQAKDTDLREQFREVLSANDWDEPLLDELIKKVEAAGYHLCPNPEWPVLTDEERVLAILDAKAHTRQEALEAVTQYQLAADMRRCPAFKELQREVKP